MNSLQSLFASLVATRHLHEVSREQIDELKEMLSLPYTLEAIGMCSELRQIAIEDKSSMSAQQINGTAMAWVRSVRDYTGKKKIIDDDLEQMAIAVALWHSSFGREIENEMLWETVIRRQPWYLELIKLEKAYRISQTANGRSSIAHAVFWFIRDSM